MTQLFKTNDFVLNFFERLLKSNFCRPLNEFERYVSVLFSLARMENLLATIFPQSLDDQERMSD